MHEQILVVILENKKLLQINGERWFSHRHCIQCRQRITTMNVVLHDIPRNLQDSAGEYYLKKNFS